MNDQLICRTCGAQLTGAAVEGLCPQCMLQEVLGQPDQADSMLPAGSMEDEGASVGRYKLREKLGEGGFGVVWVADQRRPVRRRVALKIIKLGMDTKQVIARFEAERQALARMDHPNIAKVLDAGATETGRPYFVMELIKGIPITQYCDEEKLGTQDRLDLFMKVCHAVQHSHQKGIIHRDIKPSNIMITLHDGVPVPKVIDFGIAKATQQELTEKTIYTRYSQFIGTPAYMSPEQVEMSGLDIDTRSDIYSLGVLLYELLTGNTPFDTQELLQSGLDEMRKVIREQEPVRPSTRLSQLLSQSGTSSKLATRHSSLATDLDWIVMKCLEKDRKRRYESANGLAMDLKRHLDNETVVARPPSAVYRFQKAWKRNRAVFTTTALIAVTLLAGGLVSTWLAMRESATAQRYRRLSYILDMGLAHQIYLSGDLARATHHLLPHRPTEEEEGQRGFEWYYLWDVCRRDHAVRAVPHEGFVEVAFSPDRRTFATGGCDGMIRIWDRYTLEQEAELAVDPDPHAQYRSLDLLYSPARDVLAGLFRRELADYSGRVVLFDVDGGEREPWSLLAQRDPNSVVQIAFKEDGNTLITAERDGQVRFWNASTGQPIGKALQLEPGATWRRAAFSSDLRLLAAGGPKRPQDQPGTSELRDVQIKIYDLETGALVSELQTDQSILGKLLFTQDSRYLTNPGNPPFADGKLTIWEIATQKEVYLEFDSRKCFAGAVSISTDVTDVVAVGGLDFISFVNPAKGGIVDRWDGVPGVVVDLAVSPDGTQLASTGWDGMVRLWDLPRKENPKTIELQTPTTEHLSFSPDGKLLVSADPNGVVLRDAFSFKELHRLKEQTQPVFSPAGERLTTVSTDGVTIHFWDYRSGQQNSPPVPLKGHTIKQVAFSTSGELIGCATRDWVIILDVASARIHRSFGIPSFAGSRYLAFGTNEDGQNLIAMPAGVRTVKLVNLHDGKEKILERSTTQIWGVVFSRDGLHLASSGDDIFVWNTNTGKIELTIEENTSAVAQVAFSPDGGSILSREWAGPLGLWDLQSGREKMRFLDGNPKMPRSIAISPDGNRIIAGVDWKIDRVKYYSLLVWSAPPVD
jgi:eukaryotic-like serine/threonine-protein kinase